MGKFVKIALFCIVIAALGVSMKALIPQGTFSCAAEDMPPGGQPQYPAPASDSAIKAPAPETPGTAADTAVSAAPPAATEGYDFSDTTSWNLTVSAWEHMAAKDYDGTFAYARKCIELHEEKAREMARSMQRFAPPGQEDAFALVNDVATAHYIMGEAYMKQESYDDAVKEFSLVIAEYPYAMCWDPKGWFWKVAEVSKKNLDKIEKLRKGAA